ncbi:hypothetical protein SDRG_13068 [Saprolegnia diclina VS20]|uniref:Leucine-rich repeat-containing N-terminal plant-type domain-containing protein n=1 Tax=Saprolegnia diclina (strain VS20) TaxID=1156394 RepID=T0Q6V0_SAPDV|nr:hypothetical protein SDRG_13068 [Saprolegnia diclina VS20]EQC29195.1 hypothetical protein SDRG_13068 [Saprolegnia diclina VS20]|eukprot:XP_008617373.1 hypothetical protein SDRG_13068 [Saprolegnia diclina VS20]
MLRALLLDSVASAATCPYTSLGGTSILAGDATCGSDHWCLLRPSDCTRLQYTYHATDDLFSYLGALGNLTTYTNTELTVMKSNRIDLSRMVLPPTLQALSFKHVASLSSFSDLNPSSWSELTSLSLENCSLSRLPLPLPSNVSTLKVVYNAISSLADLPAQVTFLDVGRNNVSRVSNANWSSVTSVDLSSNPLRTFANVQFSSRLVYFNIEFCQIDNFVVDTPTFAALNTLASAGDTFDADGVKRPVGYRVSENIDTNPAACAAVRGQIHKL